MSFTIRPLVKFLAAQPTRDRFTRGDLGQLEDKIRNELAYQRNNRPPGWRRAILIREKYLEILAKLHPYFAREKSVARGDWIQQVSLILEAAGFPYTSHRHPIVHDNYFDPKAAEGEFEFYDIAGYNRHAHYDGKGAAPLDSHHAHEHQRAVFYFRCEESDKQLLVGNLQFDAACSAMWRNRQLGRIMTTGKNLPEALIFAAVSYAAQRPGRKILFQCGDAVNLAQDFDVKQEEVTKANIASFRRRRKKALAKFDSITVGAQESLNLDDEDFLVIEKTSDYYVTHELTYPLDNRRRRESYLLWSLTFSFKGDLSKRAQKDLYAFEKHCRAREARLMTNALNRLFERAGISRRWLRKDLAAKVDFFQKGCQRFSKKTELARYKIHNLAERFIKKFDYEPWALTARPRIKKIPVLGSKVPGEEFCYINTTDRSSQNTFHKKRILTPRLGMIYRVDEHALETYNFLCTKTDNSYDPACLVLDWYDFYLPKVLRKFGLTLKRTSIINHASEKAHAWEIIDGWDKFHSRPHPLF